jgi:hypothetical protein
MPTKDEVFQKIQVALADALAVDEEDVTPEATLVGCTKLLVAVGKAAEVVGLAAMVGIGVDVGSGVELGSGVDVAGATASVRVMAIMAVSTTWVMAASGLSSLFCSPFEPPQEASKRASARATVRSRVSCLLVVFIFILLCC